MFGSFSSPLSENKSVSSIHFTQSGWVWDSDSLNSETTLVFPLWIIEVDIQNLLILVCVQPASQPTNISITVSSASTKSTPNITRIHLARRRGKRRGCGCDADKSVFMSPFSFKLKVPHPNELQRHHQIRHQTTRPDITQPRAESGLNVTNFTSPWPLNGGFH